MLRFVLRTIYSRSNHNNNFRHHYYYASATGLFVAGGSALLLAVSSAPPMAQLEAPSARVNDSSGTPVSQIRPSLPAKRKTTAAFKVQVALEFKEEAEKIKLAKFLKDLHELAKDSKKKSIMTELVHDQVIHDEEHCLPLYKSVDFANLKPEQAHDIIEKLQGGTKLTTKTLIAIANAAEKSLQKDPTLIDLRGKKKVVVVGDLHGSLKSLNQVIHYGKEVFDSEDSALVFDGDYVDRGHNSLEVLLIVLLLYMAYPNVIVLRGNHEDSMVSSVYGFSDELREKYAATHSRLASEMNKVFAAMPLAVRSDTAFIVHGGVPGRNFRLDDMAQVTAEQRSKWATVVEANDDLGKMMEYSMWNDPSPENGEAVNPRGKGMRFGPDISKAFLINHGLKYIVRGHEPVQYGIEELPVGDDLSVLTVFSAAAYPNDEGNNLGAIVELYDDGSYRSRCYKYKPTVNAAGNLQKFVTANVDKLQKFLSRSFLDESRAKDGLSSYIADNRLMLEEYFETISKDGTLSTEEWADAMEEVLDLQDVPWLDLQPKLAPVDKNGRINYRQFLVHHSPYEKTIRRDKNNSMSILFDNKQKLIDIFDILDTDGNGYVAKKEFVTGIETLNRRYLPKDAQLTDVDKLWKELDKNGEGEVDIKEFSNFCAKTAILSNISSALGDEQRHVLKQNKEMLLTVFHFVDASSSGAIDREEFSTAVALLNQRLSKDAQISDANELFNLLDRNGDGELEIDDFAAIFSSI